MAHGDPSSGVGHRPALIRTNRSIVRLWREVDHRDSEVGGDAVKWKELTSKQLREIAWNLFDKAHDMVIDREQLPEEKGFDVVAATEAVANRLLHEAKRREKKALPP